MQYNNHGFRITITDWRWICRGQHASAAVNVDDHNGDRLFTDLVCAVGPDGDDVRFTRGDMLARTISDALRCWWRQELPPDSTQSWAQDANARVQERDTSDHAATIAAMQACNDAIEAKLRQSESEIARLRATLEAAALSPAGWAVLASIAYARHEVYKCVVQGNGRYEAAQECRSRGLLEGNDWNPRWDRITVTAKGRDWLAGRFAPC